MKPHQRLPLDTNNRFYQSDVEDAERTQRWLDGANMKLALRWINPKKQIPTAWYAISELAPENGIKRKAIQAIIGMDGRYYAYVTATRGYGKLARSHGGASSWEDRRIAICFAYRNAIRQLLPQQANSKERLAYTSNQQDELEREYRDAGADPRDFIDFQHLPPQKGYRR